MEVNNNSKSETKNSSTIKKCKEGLLFFVYNGGFKEGF